MILHPRLLIIFAGLAPCFLALVAGQEARPTLAAEQSTSEEIAQWIEQLDSDQFTVRENAMIQLIELGSVAIDPLTAAVPEGSLEMQVRGVHVLRRLALSDEDAIASAAEYALIDIADHSRGALGKRARVAVDELSKVRQTAAIQRLESNGAVVSKSSSVSNGRRVIIPQRVEIGPSWRGTRDDLRDLKRLVDLPKLLLQGKQIDDTQLKLLLSMKNLDELSIKRAPISNQSLVTLKGIKRLSELDILYCSIDDDAIGAIRLLPRLTKLSLFGTDLTQEGLLQLRTQMPHLEVDYRKGGYLGVACTTINDRCVVSHVENGSPASQYGFQIDDIVTHFGGRELAGVNDLVKYAGTHRVGEKIEVRIFRAGQEVELTMELGEWPLKATEK